MKKLSLLLASLAFSGVVAAQAAAGGFTGPAAAPDARGGFTGPVKVVSVADAKALPDDTKVTLRGNIESHLGGKNYMFKDDSGSISVEIKHDRWEGQRVSPQDKVQIDGEVDRDSHSLEIEVKRLQKL